MTDLGILLRESLSQAEASLVGFADMTAIPAEQRLDLPRAVSIAVALDPAVVAEIGNGPTDRYRGEYDRRNEQLDALARLASGLLIATGFRALPSAATVVTLDEATLSTPLPHKTAATRSGLGWIGKCALLVTEMYGSAVRLNTVLTDAPLPVAVPVEASRCGRCTECVRWCPGRAPSGEEWRAGSPRELLFDAFACRRAARALSARIGYGGTICGRCIAVCPWTERYLRREGAQPVALSEEPLLG
ncbi:MAG: 4Fe-4S double cluster binding domain-containing protein [Anaerolineae bacterium]